MAMANAMGQRLTIASRQQVEAFDTSLGGTATLRAVAANGFVRDRMARVPRVNTENERSLCFLLLYDGFHYLIGGDTIGRSAGSENAEVELAIGEYLRDNNINVDVLHVNHHGANNGSEAAFLALVDPEVAIISLGNDNSHEHPDDEALTRLVQAGVSQIYQTNWGTTEGETPVEVRRRQAILQGDILLTTDGTTYTISTARAFAVDQ